MRVIVTGAGALLGQGVIRAIRQARSDCRIAGVDPEPLSAGLYWCDAGYRGRLASDPVFVSTLRQIILAEQADIVIPGTDAELAVLARHRANLEAETGCVVLVSSPEIVQIADDKLETAAFFRANGFPFPMSAAGEDSGAVASLVEACGFPVIVKPRIGARSEGVHVVETGDDLARALRRPGGMVQELIGTAGQEFTAGSLYMDDACQGCITMRRDLRDGNTYRAFVVTNPALDAWVRRWTEALRPFGPANFQFRQRPDGTPVVFEINARYSGTTPLRALAGFNEVAMMLDRISTGRPIEMPVVTPITVLRHWSETVVSQDQINAIRLPG